MKLTKTTGLVAAVCGLVAFCTADAAAQAPALSVTANGANVTIQWTAVPGALGYNLQVGTTPGGTEIATVNLPNTITHISVDAPPNTYYLRVRGLAGNIFGPFSNEASVTVGDTSGPGVTPCGVTAPSISVNVTGGSVTVNWGAVPGTAGYRIEFSRFPNATELVQTVNASTTSFTQYVGMLGTFYVRVVAGDACGTATSETVAFTITDLNSGSGPRTPDPPPGQLLPLPSYGEAVVFEMARRYPGELFNSCNNHTWVYLVLQELRKRDSRWGLNYKRGNEGDLSHDIITYNPTNRPDRGESQIYVIDIISGHCGSRPAPAWIDQTRPTWDGRGHPACGTEWCAKWTIDPYLRAGFPPDPRP